MPHPAQSSLTHVLLLWITVLSVTQIVFITIFFTGGQRGLSRNSAAITAEQFQNCSGEGKVATFKAIRARSSIKWEAKTPCEELVSEQGSEGENYLTIKKDGYYFLNLQVTLKKAPSCKDVSQGAVSCPTVRLKNKENSILLQGRINRDTLSTGLLSKVAGLPAGVPLLVEIDPPSPDIDETDFLTYLDIVYMFKH